jgi:hypothetical protein
MAAAGGDVAVMAGPDGDDRLLSDEPYYGEDVADCEVTPDGWVRPDAE